MSKNVKLNDYLIQKAYEKIWFQEERIEALKKESAKARKDKTKKTVKTKNKRSSKKTMGRVQKNNKKKVSKRVLHVSKRSTRRLKLAHGTPSSKRKS